MNSVSNVHLQVCDECLPDALKGARSYSLNKDDAPEVKCARCGRTNEQLAAVREAAQGTSA